jgi:hypothetical protein
MLREMSLREILHARNWISASILFTWRLARNLLCILPVSRNWLFPEDVLAAHFGPAKFSYAWDVFLRHRNRLKKFGFTRADCVLEVGPGRNLGTALLWWVSNAGLPGQAAPVVVLWDVYPNAQIDQTGVWAIWAKGLLKSMPSQEELAPTAVAWLEKIARGNITPSIQYEVCALNELRARFEAGRFDLVYSQAALEHAWDIRDMWGALVALTATRGWHSHRIDLADHGRRDTNYIEMLEWSRLSYWLTMRFIPGAINRWRASEHVSFLVQSGFEVFCAEREIRNALPGPKSRLAKQYQDMDDFELRTTAIDVVARHV